MRPVLLDTALLILTLITTVAGVFMWYGHQIRATRLEVISAVLQEKAEEMKQRTLALQEEISHVAAPPPKPKRVGPPFIYVGLYEEELAEDERKSVIQ